MQDNRDGGDEEMGSQNGSGRDVGQQERRQKRCMTIEMVFF